MACDRGDHGNCTRCGVAHTGPGVDKDRGRREQSRVAAIKEARRKAASKARYAGQRRLRWQDQELGQT